MNDEPVPYTDDEEEEVVAAPQKRASKKAEEATPAVADISAVLDAWGDDED